MPLLSTFSCYDISVLLWKIEETSQHLMAMLPEEEDISECSGFRSETRRCEWLVERLLLRHVFPSGGVSISHRSNGSPFLAGPAAGDHYISLSHTQGFVVMAFACFPHFGIDIEYVSDRADRVAGYFINEGEIPVTCSSPSAYRQVLWCAKESLFKSLVYACVNDMKKSTIAPFVLSEKGEAKALVSYDGREYNADICYQRHSSYVLTIARLSDSHQLVHLKR